MSLTAKRPSQSNPDKAKLLNQVTGESTKRLNADVDPRLYHEIKIHCAHENRTISEMTRYLWIEYLKNLKQAN